MVDIAIGYTDRVMLIGITGTGKTNLLKMIIFDYKDLVPILIYDDEDEHTYLPKVEDFNKIEGSCRYVPKCVTEKPRIEEFNEICGQVFRKRNIIFVVENVDLYAMNKKPQPNNFVQIIKKGRKRGIGVLMTSQRIADCHKFPCSQSKRWFIYHTHLPNDVTYLKRFVGDASEQARHLKDYHFLYWEKGMKEAVVCSPVPNMTQI